MLPGITTGLGKHGQGTKRISQELGTVVGSGCITAVERMPHDREVVGLNPAGCWAFFLFSIPSVVRALNSGLSWRCNTTDFLIKYALPRSLRQIKLNMHGLSKKAWHCVCLTS